MGFLCQVQTDVGLKYSFEQKGLLGNGTKNHLARCEKQQSNKKHKTKNKQNTKTGRWDRRSNKSDEPTRTKRDKDNLNTRVEEHRWQQSTAGLITRHRWLKWGEHRKARRDFEIKQETQNMTSLNFTQSWLLQNVRNVSNLFILNTCFYFF